MVEGDPDHPANFRATLHQRLCTVHLTAKLDARAPYPELRTERGAERQRSTWDDALNHVVDKFADTIAQHGPDSVAFYISGQLLTEDYYVFNKLA